MLQLTFMNWKHTVKGLKFLDETQTTPQKSSRLFKWQITMVATCQSQGSPTLKHTLLYGLFYSKWDCNLPNEQHVVFNKTSIQSDFFSQPVESPPSWPLERMHVYGTSALASLFRSPEVMSASSIQSMNMMLCYHSGFTAELTIISPLCNSLTPRSLCSLQLLLPMSLRLPSCIFLCCILN